MNNAQQTARVGLFFLIGIALIWVTFETLSNGKLFKDKGYAVVAGFDDLKQLKASDDVSMAGVKIGSVESTRLAGRRAEAVLRIEPGYKIASDATASIEMSGLLGTNYVGITLGSVGAAPIPDGGEVRTVTTPDINSIMAEVGELGKKLQASLGSFSDAMNGNGKEGGGLFQKLDRLVTDNSEKVNATLTNLQQITDKINRGDGTIGRLVNDPRLHDELLAAVSDIRATANQAKEFVTNAQSIMDQIKSGQGTLGTLIYDQKSAENIRASIENIKVVSDRLAKGQGTLGKLISDDSLYNETRSTMKKADRALDSLGDSGPITAVGIVANSLF